MKKKKNNKHTNKEIKIRWEKENKTKKKRKTEKEKEAKKKKNENTRKEEKVKKALPRLSCASRPNLYLDLSPPSYSKMLL